MNEIKIKNENGILTVSSLQIARDFGKRHDHVVRDIEILIENMYENPILGFHKSAENSAQTSTYDTHEESMKPQNWGVKNFFIESTYKVTGNKKTYKCYDVTRDGFALLIMGFTGKEALTWKIKYIEAFNNMEKQLIEIHSGTGIISDKILKENINMLNQRLYKLELKLDTMEKNSGIRTEDAIEKIQKIMEIKLCETVHALIPCFECIHNKLIKVRKKRKNK